MGFRACAAQRTSYVDETAQFVKVRGIGICTRRECEEFRQLGERRHAEFVAGEERAAARRAEADRALAQVIAHAEDIVGLRESACRFVGHSSLALRCSLDQCAAPAVGRDVGERDDRHTAYTKVAQSTRFL